MAMSKEEFIQALKEMSVIELNELVKAFETEGIVTEVREVKKNGKKMLVK